MTHHRPSRSCLGIVLATVALTGASAAEPSSDLPPPNVSVHVEAANPTGPWKLVVTNRSAASLLFAADGRLLKLVAQTEEEAPKKKKKKDAPTTCRLPAGLRPSGVAEDRAVVLPPGARYEELFAPELYCFTAKERALLAPGTKLVPILGFDVPDAKPKAKPKPPTSPFVAEDAAPTASVAPVKAILGEAFIVPAAPLAPPSQGPAGTSLPADLVINTAERVDAEEASSIDLLVTVTNKGRLAATVRLRRDLFTFDVDGPNGPFRCGTTPGQRTIPRDLYGPLPSGGAQSLSVRLVEPCPDDAFSRPGLYTVRARLVVKATLDKTPGIRPWTGEATAKETTLLRVRTGDVSFYRGPPVVITAREGG